MRWKAAVPVLATLQPSAKVRWALPVQAAYLERNSANELPLAKNYVNKMISARESR
jgi:hypothetical protein